MAALLLLTAAALPRSASPRADYFAYRPPHKRAAISPSLTPPPWPVAPVGKQAARDHLADQIDVLPCPALNSTSVYGPVHPSHPLPSPNPLPSPPKRDISLAARLRAMAATAPPKPEASTPSPAPVVAEEEEQEDGEEMLLPSGTDERELKLRFKQLAAKLHPDVNGSDDALEQFQLLSSEYSQRLDECRSETQRNELASAWLQLGGMSAVVSLVFGSNPIVPAVATAAAVSFASNLLPTLPPIPPLPNPSRAAAGELPIALPPSPPPPPPSPSPLCLCGRGVGVGNGGGEGRASCGGRGRLARSKPQRVRA